MSFVMSPYRHKVNSPSDEDAPAASFDDEPIILWLSLVVGLVPAAYALIRGVVWGAAPTLGLLVCVLSGLGLLGRARAALRERRESKKDQ